MTGTIPQQAGLADGNEPWRASVPVVPGLDNLHTFTATRRHPDDGSRRTAPGNLEAGALRSTGPSADPRVDPVDMRGDWEARRWSNVVAGKVGVTDTDGEPVPNGSLMRPRDPRNVTVAVERPVTQLTGPAMYSYVRPFGNRYAKRFNGDHASFATPATAQPATSYAMGRGRRRFRPTQRVVPEPMESQIVAVQDIPANVGYSVLPVARPVDGLGWL